MSPTIVQTFHNSWDVPDGTASAQAPNFNLQFNLSGVTPGNWLIACVAWHGIPKLPAAISVGDDAANFWQPVAISPANLSGTPLNANPNFSSGLTGWTAFSAAASIQSTVVYPGNTQAAKMVPNGGTATRCYLQSSPGTVTASQYYTTSMWVYSPTGYATAICFLGWTNSGTFISTTSSPNIAIPAGVWTQLTVSGLAPATANQGFSGIQFNNSPQPGDIFYVGQGTLTAGNGFSASTRCAIWAAPNTLSSTNRVSAVALGSVTAMTGTVLEVSGMPSWLQINATSTFLAKRSSTVSATITPTASSFLVAVGANNDFLYSMFRQRFGWSSASYFSGITNNVDTVGDIQALVATKATSSSATLANFYGTNPINTNPTFASGLTGWQAVNGTLALSSHSSFFGTHVGVLTPNGTSSIATVDWSTVPGVTPNLTYFGDAYVFTTGHSSSVKLGLEWQTAGHAVISTVFSSTFTVPPDGTLYNLFIQGIAPATAAFVNLRIASTGTPPASHILSVAEGSVTPVSNTPPDSAIAMAAFQLTPTNVPTQPNANWPALKLEAAFGQAASTTPDQLVWTDISNRLFNVTMDRGRQYELNALQTANISFVLRNDDGYLTPGSSLDPGLHVYTPFRLTALNSGRQYSVVQGYIERWPQTWADPHYGLVNAVGVDSWSMFTATLPTIVRGEILSARPMVYWPCADGASYSSAVNIGLTSNQTQLVMTKSPFGVGSSSASFGDSTIKLPGDTNTNWICKGLTNTQGSDGTSLVYNGQPLPPLNYGLTISFWFNISYTGPVTAQTIYIFTMVGTGGPILALTMDSGAGLHIFTWNAATGVMTDHGSFGFGFASSDFFFTLTLNATSFTAYVNSTSYSTGTETFATTWSYFNINGRNDAFTAGNFGNMAISHVVVYPRILSPNEIDTNFFAGSNAENNDFADQRVSRLISLLQWQPPQRIVGGLTFADLMVGAIDIDGMDIASAITNIANTEQALLYVDRMGYVVFRPRVNATLRPILAVLGENTGAGELPYRVTLQLDYDPQYINNDVQVTHVGNIPAGQTSPSSTLITQKNATSINKYGDHSLQLNSYFGNISQSYNLANYLLSQYSEPLLRVAQIELIPSANPAQFATLLALDIGDRVTLNRRPIGAPVISIQVMIIGIHHDIEWKTGRWTVRFDLMPASIAVLQTKTWTLDTAVLDVLDSTNVIGW
jgi:hypothetical protein